MRVQLLQDCITLTQLLDRITLTLLQDHITLTQPPLHYKVAYKPAPPPHNHIDQAALGLYLSLTPLLPYTSNIPGNPNITMCIYEQVINAYWEI